MTENLQRVNMIPHSAECTQTGRSRIPDGSVAEFPQSIGVVPSPASLHYASVMTALPQGIGARRVKLEVSLHRGLPYFDLVGIPSAAASAIKSRVRAAIKNSGYDFPSQRIIASVSPEGSCPAATCLDLPIALALLQASGQLNMPEGIAAAGELSLLGNLENTPSAYNIFQVLASSRQPLILSSRKNEAEAVLSGGRFVLASSLIECCCLLDQARSWKDIDRTDLSNDVLHPEVSFELPVMAKLSGQYLARKALMIAAAGRHHMIMIGGPGSGKSSLAELLPCLLPSLTMDEQREVLSIYSAAGFAQDPAVLQGRPPLRKPHYNITNAALVGGGMYPLPGELSLGHHGILFMDELTEFDTAQIDLLRTALNERVVHVARSGGRVKFPADIMFLGACNPCHCGNYLEGDRSCSCTSNKIKQKLGKLSGPFCDRIDLFIELRRIPEEDLHRTIAAGNLCDIQAMAAEVAGAVDIQKERYRGFSQPGIRNSTVAPNLIQQCFLIEKDALHLAEKLAGVNRLSIRGFQKLLRTGRTIADLEGSETLRTGHVSMASQFSMKPYMAASRDSWGNT